MPNTQPTKNKSSRPGIKQIGMDVRRHLIVEPLGHTQNAVVNSYFWRWKNRNFGGNHPAWENVEKLSEKGIKTLSDALYATNMQAAYAKEANIKGIQGIEELNPLEAYLEATNNMDEKILGGKLEKLFNADELPKLDKKLVSERDALGKQLKSLRKNNNPQAVLKRLQDMRGRVSNIVKIDSTERRKLIEAHFAKAIEGEKSGVRTELVKGLIADNTIQDGNNIKEQLNELRDSTIAEVTQTSEKHSEAANQIATTISKLEHINNNIQQRRRAAALYLISRQDTSKVAEVMSKTEASHSARMDNKPDIDNPDLKTAMERLDEVIRTQEKNQGNILRTPVRVDIRVDSLAKGTSFVDLRDCSPQKMNIVVAHQILLITAKGGDSITFTANVQPKNGKYDEKCIKQSQALARIQLTQWVNAGQSLDNITIKALSQNDKGQAILKEYKGRDGFNALFPGEEAKLVKLKEKESVQNGRPSNSNSTEKTRESVQNIRREHAAKEDLGVEEPNQVPSA